MVGVHGQERSGACRACRRIDHEAAGARAAPKALLNKMMILESPAFARILEKAQDAHRVRGVRGVSLSLVVGWVGCVVPAPMLECPRPSPLFFGIILNSGSNKRRS